MDTAPEDDSERPRPKIDLSKSLGEAGHEVEELGFEGVPDSGPVEETTETIEAAEAAERDRDLALERGRFGLPKLRKG